MYSYFRDTTLTEIILRSSIDATRAPGLILILNLNLEIIAPGDSGGAVTMSLGPAGAAPGRRPQAWLPVPSRSLRIGSWLAPAGVKNPLPQTRPYLRMRPLGLRA